MILLHTNIYDAANPSARWIRWSPPMRWAWAQCWSRTTRANFRGLQAGNWRTGWR